jgi:hypothetical protein
MVLSTSELPLPISTLTLLPKWGRIITIAKWPVSRTAAAQRKAHLSEPCQRL